MTKAEKFFLRLFYYFNYIELEEIECTNQYFVHLYKYNFFENPGNIFPDYKTVCHLFVPCAVKNNRNLVELFVFVILLQCFKMLKFQCLYHSIKI